MPARKTAKKKPAAKKLAVKKTVKAKAKKPASNDPVARVRAICLGLPETTEVEAWGAPTFRVKGKIFVMYAAPGSHHTAGRPAIWILSVNIEQDLVLRARPDRYFKPPYVGPGGWIGAYVDKNPPWAEIEELIRDGWRRRAPKKIAAQFEV
jgi:hypothetical protein